MRCAPMLWAALLVASGATPAEPAPDDDLLEFLGSVDSSEPGWHEFLESRPRGAARRVPTRSAPPPPPPAPDRRQVKP